MKKETSGTDHLFVCYCLLKADDADRWGSGRLQQLSETLYRAQAYYEDWGAVNDGQAFVYGNGEAAVRPFAIYETGFRAAMDEQVRRYDIGEALLLSYGALDEYMPREDEPADDDGSANVYRLVIIADYLLATDNEAVTILMERMNQLKARCDFKVCYLDAQGKDRSGSLAEIIDVYGLA